MLHQESSIAIEDDPIMIELFVHLDALSAFVKLHEAWLTVNTATWHSEELNKALSVIFVYINQLASYISLNHEHIDVQINVDYDEMKGKQFATIIKRTDEWKALKKWMSKSTHDFRNQPLTVEALAKVIITQTNKFISKI